MEVLRNQRRWDLFGTTACVLIGVALRLLVVMTSPDQLDRDRDAYLGIAQGIADGRGFSIPGTSTPTAFRPPLYPVCIAAGLRFLPSNVVVAGINLLSGAVTVWVTLSLGRQLGLGWRRYPAAVLVAADPLLNLYAAQPMTESLCTALSAVWLWAAERIPSDENAGQRRSSGIVCGVFFGLLVLCRPTFWLVPLLYGLNRLWTFAWTGWKTSSWIISSSDLRAVCGTLAVIAPWLIRNWIVFGVPILSTTHGGYTLILGNNPDFYDKVVSQPWGTVWQNDQLLSWQSALETQISRDLGPDASEIQRDNWHSGAARKFISLNPKLFGLAVIHRIRSLWNTVPQGDSGDGTPQLVKVAVGWYYACVLAVSVLGLGVVLRSERRGQWIPLMILIASVQMAHLVYWTNARMRAPLTPAIALLAASVLPIKGRGKIIILDKGNQKPGLTAPPPPPGV